MTAIAYSYVRFSTPDQAKGDSLRRQMDSSDAWCTRNGVKLDTATSLHDLGKSAFSPTKKHTSAAAAFLEPEDLVNADRRALAGFLALIKARKVPRGAFLIIENLDRLSRDDVVPATHLLTGILLSGVKVVQLKPVEQILTGKSDGYAIMMAIMELSRGHGESAMKAERCGAAWAKKKQAARNGHIVSERLPGWVTIKGGKLVLVPEAAAAVRRIFHLSANGYGSARIVEQLTNDGVPAIGGRCDYWNRAYVGLILRDRRVLGEYQPMRKKERDGDPIPGYYPAAVTEKEYFAARAGAAERGKYHGRTGAATINVFAGLVKNALEGDSYFMMARYHEGKRHTVLMNNRGQEGTSPLLTFPYKDFEEAILSHLVELDPRDIIGRHEGADESMAITGELATVERKIASLEAELESGDVPSLARALRSLEVRKRDLAARLEDARAKAANPLTDSWGECRSLATILKSAADPQDAQLRLRSALRRIVSRIWVLVVPKKRDRLAAVQVYFQGGEQHRDYLIYHRIARRGFGCSKPSSWRAWSLADVVEPGDLDLRKKHDVAALVRLLEKLDTTELQRDGAAE